MTKNPEVERNVIFSTAHLTEHDANIFENKESRDDLPVFKSNFLYRVNIASYNDSPESFRKAGLSGCCIEILDWAANEGYDNVVFDCDGPVYDDVIRFHW
jgi:hypothetical protein